MFLLEVTGLAGLPDRNIFCPCHCTGRYLEGIHQCVCCDIVFAFVDNVTFSCFDIPTVTFTAGLRCLGCDSMSLIILFVYRFFSGKSDTRRSPSAPLSVVSCVVSCRVVSYRVVSCRLVSCRFVLCRFVSFRVVSCRFVSFCVVSSRLESFRVVSCRSALKLCGLRRGVREMPTLKKMREILFCSSYHDRSSVFPADSVWT